MQVREFFKRWKGGIETITPLQQSTISLMGGFIVLAGVVIGLITTFLVGVWWLFIVLCGSLFLTLVSLIGGLQKYWALKSIYKEVRMPEKETEEKKEESEEDKEEEKEE